MHPHTPWWMWLTRSAVVSLVLVIGGLRQPSPALGTSEGCGEPTSPSLPVVRVRLSHYWPPYGPPNCSRFLNGRCVSRMASGERWEDWIGRAAACPREWPFGTRFRLPGGEEFTCMDRGSRIVYGPDGVPWVDLLVLVPPVPYGTIIDVVMLP